MNKIVIAAVLGTTAIGGVVYATQAATSAAAPKPMKGDADGNGELTRREFIARAEARFAALDTDRNGSLTRAERRAGHHGGKHRGAAMGGPFEPLGQEGTAPPPPPGAMRGARAIERADTDGDGRMSRAEYAAQSAKRFARIDANGDGTVDAAEMAAAPGNGRGMARMDADGSGSLTLAEFEARGSRMFERMDANADGFVDQAERDAMRGQRSNRRAPQAAPTPPAPANPGGA